MNFNGTCNVSVAVDNVEKGICPIAKCAGDDRYAKGCKRRQRAYYSKIEKSCCLKLCHLENDKNETCSLTDGGIYQKSAYHGSNMHTLSFNCFLTIVFLLLLRVRRW